jgi:hypothetical protein
MVGDRREQPAQLDGGSELAALIEGRADRGGLCVSHNEHAESMGRRTTGDNESSG